jgi:hypothetical protein
MAFQEYPKAMSHPHYQPAVLSRDTTDPVTHQTIKAAPGSPAKFPPVYVNNKDQEADYAAKGYVPNGVSDPDEYLSSVIKADKPQGHTHVDFPKYLYGRDDDDGDMLIEAESGEHVRVRSLLIKDQAAQDKLVGSWYATPGDAANGSDEDEAAAEEPADEGEPGEQAQTSSRGGKKR